MEVVRFKGGIMRYKLKGLLIFIIGLSCVSLDMNTLTNGDNFKILYEKRFDKKIEKVAFDSYMENGEKHYYPKFIVLNHIKDIPLRSYDRESGERGKTHLINKEILINTPEGILENRIGGILHCDRPTYVFGFFYFPNSGGNYFAIEQGVNKDRLFNLIKKMHFSKVQLREVKWGKVKKLVHGRYLDEFLTHYGELPEPKVTFYNGKGRKLWDIPRDTFKPLGISYVSISPEDGKSVIGKLGEGSDVMIYSLYDSLGNEISPLPPLPSVSYDYLPHVIDFSNSWDCALVGFDKEPFRRYKELPGKSCEPGIILLDSVWNVIWEKSFGEYLLTGITVSPKGSFVGVGTHTMKGTERHGTAEEIGRLFDKGGNFIMEIPWEAFVGTHDVSNSFSNNERYLLTMSGRKKFSLIDINSKEIIMEKEFPYRILKNDTYLSVSNEGNCLLIFGHGGKAQIYLMDEEGEVINNFIDVNIWDVIPRNKELYHILGWKDGRPILGVIDNNSVIIGHLTEKEEK